MPKKKEKTAPTCCNCGSALLVTKVCARRFVALCSKPCIETIMCYGQSEDEVVENYTNTMKEQAGRRKRRSK